MFVLGLRYAYMDRVSMSTKRIQVIGKHVRVCVCVCVHVG